MPGRTEDNHQPPQPGQALSRPKFKPSICQISYHISIMTAWPNLFNMRIFL